MRPPIQTCLSKSERLTMSKIAQLAVRATCLNKSGVVAKLWPNGEIAFHLPKKMKELPLSRERVWTKKSATRSFLRQAGISSEWLEAFLVGLSSVRNFDKPKTSIVRYGLKGITSLGRRRVRNAAYMLEKEHGKERLTFSTVTLPPMHDEDMVLLHLQWHKVIDRYRLLLSRHLRKFGLPGEIIGVTEIQEGRYEEKGFPVLHGHFVFLGAARRYRWAVSPARHDYIWRKSIQSVLCGPLPKLDAACQLKEVEKSVEGYLGKYMSKGPSAIAAVVADGYEWAMPKQWWSCTRALVRRMKKQMREFSEGVPWLVSKASDGDSEIWAFYRVVTITMPDGVDVDVGSYGRLTPDANKSVRRFLSL